MADKEGVQDAVVEALFRAYFTDGQDISDRQTLIEVVVEARLDRGKAEAVLNSDDGLEAIKEADELARRFRVEGVPFFIVNGKITLSGAQHPDAFLEAFGQEVGGKLWFSTPLGTMRSETEVGLRFRGASVPVMTKAG